MATEKRSDDDIVTRLRSVMDTDFLGFKAEVLVPYLGYDHAVEFMRADPDTGEPAIGRDEWEERALTRLAPAAAGADYLPFAVGKIEDERGISASRSVEKLTEWAWLDEQDDLVADMSNPVNYGHYGDAAVRLYAEHYGLPWSREGEER